MRVPASHGILEVIALAGHRRREAAEPARRFPRGDPEGVRRDAAAQAAHRLAPDRRAAPVVGRIDVEILSPPGRRVQKDHVHRVAHVVRDEDDAHGDRRWRK